MSDLVERLQSHMGLADMQEVLADCRLAASRISQQDAELEWVRRELEDLEIGLSGSTAMRTVVGGEYSVQIHFNDLDAMQAYLRCIRSLCAALRAKADGENNG